jgi:hypothetical protein
MSSHIAALRAEVDCLAESNGQVRSNEAASEVERLCAQIREAHDEVQRARAGALLGAALMRCPGVSSFRLHMDVSMEYDDAGGCFPSVALTLDDIDELDHAGEIDRHVESDGAEEENVEEALFDELEDERDVLYKAFGAELDCYATVDLLVKRDDLRDALAHEPVSGRAVYAALTTAQSKT